MAKTKLFSKKQFWAIAGVVVALAVGIATILGGAFSQSPAASVHRGSDNASNSGVNSGNICTDHSVCNPPTTTTSTLPPPIDLSQSCPDPDPTIPTPPPVNLCVVYWCHGNQYTPNGVLVQTEYQIKLRPLISNFSGTPVNVSIDKPSALRLLVIGSDIPANWQPLAATANYGDAPVLVSYSGAQYWAIAPNRPGTEVPVNGAWTGFATTWNYQNVGASGTAGTNQPVRDLQDLVFDVPVSQVTASGSVDNIEGLALMSYSNGIPSVTSMALFHDWQLQKWPTDF